MDPLNIVELTGNQFDHKFTIKNSFQFISALLWNLCQEACRLGLKIDSNI